MLIFVLYDNCCKNKETLIFGDFKFRCCVGKKGFIRNKEEGDKKATTGIFKIGDLYYRKDKKLKPKTKLKIIDIKKNIGWCNDINSKQYYNKPVEVAQN